MSSLLGEESTFPMPPSDGNKEESVMTIEENCSDTSPGVKVANEEFDDMHQKCGCCAYSNRRSNGNVTFWVLAILTVLVVAGGTLTAVILMSKNESTSNEAAENDGSLKQRSEAYYKERYEVFRQIAGGVSTSEAQIQSDTPSSKALDWMVYKDTTIPHELLQQSNLDAASTLTQFNQRYAIMVLFYACGGEEWQGFVSHNIEQQGHIDTCLWDDDDFVACNDVHEVVELQLDFRRLGGTLPAELRVLTSLETLDISYNFLDGTVPDNLFQGMSNLSTSQIVAGTDFRLGSAFNTFHFFIGIHTENLFLNNNEFIGNVPTSIGMATGLRNMDLSFNFFTGSLPAELATLPEIQRFSAKDNLLTGPFFEPFGTAWSQLEHLNLDGTQFTGTIPADVLNTWASSMIDLKLGFTQFHGRLPSEIGELSQLTGLNINGPKLQGTVPDLAKLTHLGVYLMLVQRVL